MHERPTNADNSRQSKRWKPLTQAQENALLLLIQGKSDVEVAADPGVCVTRQTVWEWRHRDPRFQAELERRRGEVHRQACERLRSLLAKAVENLAAKVEAGDYEASLQILKAVGVYGNGEMNRLNGVDPERHFEAEVERRLAAEKIPGQLNDMLIKLDNPRKHQRRAEIEAELRAQYGEDE